MHDGRAADLEAAVDDMLANSPPQVDASAEQRDVLLVFLRSL